MLQISVVSYLNSLPFIYGLKNTAIVDKACLNIELPVNCAKSFYTGKSDIALIPVGFLPSLNSFNIVSDYCIGADGEVKTVLLLSQVKINEIKTIHLDNHSVTSAKLIKILAEKYWKISPKWQEVNLENDNKHDKHESVLMIGDKTFQSSKSYKYSYDLSQEWKAFTGLPFVFACWVSRQQNHEYFSELLNTAFSKGINSLEQISFDYSKNNCLSEEEVYSYLSGNIKYNFDESLKKGMNKFISML